MKCQSQAAGPICFCHWPVLSHLNLAFLMRQLSVSQFCGWVLPAVRWTPLSWCRIPFLPHHSLRLPPGFITFFGVCPRMTAAADHCQVQPPAASIALVLAGAEYWNLPTLSLSICYIAVLYDDLHGQVLRGSEEISCLIGPYDSS